MDLRRLRAGEWITAAAGVVLIVSLFLPWYEAGPVEVTAWEAYSAVDVLLLVSGAIGVGVLVITAWQATAAVGIATQALALLVTGAIAVVALLRVLNLPGDLDAAGAGRTAFAWIGLLAAFGVAVGTVIAMRDERISSARPAHGPDRPADRRPARDRDLARAPSRRLLVNYSRLLRADVIAAVAALVLLFVMALDWYSTVAGKEARRIEELSQPQRRGGR